MPDPNQTQAIEQLLRPVIEDRGYELVDTQFRTEHGRRILRLLVDRPGGITIGECASLSREVAPHLEVADPIRGSYVLEVSSPGIHRPLRRPDDFVRFRDQRVVVRTVEPVDNRKTFRGISRGLDEDGRVVVEGAQAGQRWTFAWDEIREAHLDPEIRF